MDKSTISYRPLRVYLAENNIDINTLETRRGGVVNEATVSKLRHDKPVNLESIAKICVFLDVPIEKVVEISSI